MKKLVIPKESTFRPITIEDLVHKLNTHSGIAVARGKGGSVTLLLVKCNIPPATTEDGHAVMSSREYYQWIDLDHFNMTYNQTTYRTIDEACRAVMRNSGYEVYHLNGIYRLSELIEAIDRDNAGNKV